ncbi:hypothetical protein [Nostoc sp.]
MLLAFFKERSLFNHQPEIALETWQQAEKIYKHPLTLIDIW